MSFKSFKNILLIVGVLSIVFFAILLFSEIFNLKNDYNKVELNVKIKSFEIDDVNGDIYFDVIDESGNQIKCYISSIYSNKFNLKLFKETYATNEIYKIGLLNNNQVLDDQYQTIISLSLEKNAFLDGKKVINSLRLNDYIGIIISFIGIAGGIFLLWLVISKKYLNIKWNQSWTGSFYIHLEKSGGLSF